MRARVVVETIVTESSRVEQVRGMFDLAPAATDRRAWDVELPLEGQPWAIGLVVGPSGCGKSTIARKLWPHALAISASLTWPASGAIVDAFPESLGIKEVVALLTGCGLSSVPAWLRPWRVLSTGEQFRATLARMLGESIALPDTARGIRHFIDKSPLIVYDEFTSTVDRTVAQIASAALAKTVRRHGLQFIAVTCHEDVEEWLQPDWVYRPAEETFTRRSLRRRPDITLEIVRCRASAWQLFAPHHYLSEKLNASATCFLATWRSHPACFTAWLPFVGSGRAARREHRTVCLPDFQGVGIGNAVSDTLAGMWAGLGYGVKSTTTHPAMIGSRARSPHWRLTRAPALCLGVEKVATSLKHANARLTAGFEWVGPRMNRTLAKMLLGE